MGFRQIVHLNALALMKDAILTALEQSLMFNPLNSENIGNASFSRVPKVSFEYHISERESKSLGPFLGFSTEITSNTNNKVKTQLPTVFQRVLILVSFSNRKTKIAMLNQISGPAKPVGHL